MQKIKNNQYQNRKKNIRTELETSEKHNDLNFISTRKSSNRCYLALKEKSKYRKMLVFLSLGINLKVFKKQKQFKALTSGVGLSWGGRTFTFRPFLHWLHKDCSHLKKLEMEIRECEVLLKVVQYHSQY